MARGADCVPVAARRPRGRRDRRRARRPSGVARASWAGTVARMRELGADRIPAWVGPHVCGACYEVPEEMRDEVAAVVPAAPSTTSWGTPALDLGAGVRAQLADAGVASSGRRPAAPARTPPGLLPPRRRPAPHAVRRRDLEQAS